jgi:hypothetical protein
MNRLTITLSDTRYLALKEHPAAESFLSPRAI